jgi:ribosomal protein S18 acetylase RimI-like enzyme
LTRATAADVDRTSAAAALDAVFAKYVVPLSFPEPVYAIHVQANDVVLGASPIWYGGDGNVVAAGLLAVRGTRGWIGGFGVVPAHRGEGLGRALLADMLERAHALALESVTLEVLAENPAARKVYEDGGFIAIRRLASFVMDTRRIAPVRGDAPYADAVAFLDADDATMPCWQRETASLRHQANLHAVGDDRAFAVFRHNGEVAQLLKVRAASVDQFARLSASVAGETGVARMKLFNEPIDSGLAEAARSLGWSEGDEMDEMRWP